MIKEILSLMLIFSSTAAAGDKKYYAGDEVEVCSPPDEIVHKFEIVGSPYFLNYESKNSTTYLTIVVWNSDIPKLEINPYTYFETANFCVKGQITLYRDARQIILSSPEQLFISKNQQ